MQSDNGREFRNKIVQSLKELWPELKFVHGKPRHSQSQGSVERANQDIENMLTAWMHDNNSTKWSKGLKHIQFMKNRSYHSGIKRSPYEAMFGCPARFGLKSTNLPEEIYSQLETEDDFIQAVDSLESTLNTPVATKEPSLLPETEPILGPSDIIDETSSNLTPLAIVDNIQIFTDNKINYICSVCGEEVKDLDINCYDCTMLIHEKCGKNYENQLFCHICFSKKKLLGKEKNR